jgi:hypothetical protein
VREWSRHTSMLVGAAAHGDGNGRDESADAYGG